MSPARNVERGLKIHKRSGAAMPFHRAHPHPVAVYRRSGSRRRQPKNKALNRRADSVCRSGVTTAQKLKRFVIAPLPTWMRSHSFQVPFATIALSRYLLG
jgi:hypothetical protein